MTEIEKIEIKEQKPKSERIIKAKSSESIKKRKK